MSLPRQRFLLMLILLLSTVSPAAAQTTAYALLSPPETSEFPTLHSYLEAYDANGAFLHDLQPGEVTIIEDSRAVPVKQLNKEEIGAKFIVALNQGPSFAIQDSNAVSRFDPLRTVLTAWAEDHLAEQDDLSFITNGGVEALNIRTGVEWLQSFQAFEADFRNAVPSLDVLVRAIEVASEPTDRVGMNRSILLLTPPPEFPTTGTLQSLLSLAKEENIRIHVWMVSSPDAFTSTGAGQLSDLAAQTGGTFFAFSGNETIPEIEPYLEPFRYIYALSYDSQIRKGESHQVFARINKNGTQVESNMHEFDLEILPPNPIFISPPLEIIRTNQATLSDALSEITAYVPESQRLEILVEFPDSRPRDLTRTTLYADGTAVDENSAPPFDTFIWDLRPYEASGSHILQAEAVDALGLSNTSIELTIQLTVKQSPQRMLSTMVDNAPVIAGATAALAGGLLLLVLVVRGHIRPRSFGRRRKKVREAELSQPDPNETANEIETETGSLPRRRFSKWINQISWSPRGSQVGQDPRSTKIVAYLEYLESNERQKPAAPIEIKVGETTFGRDPTQATTILNDPAVDNLHARLVIDSNGTCLIYDEGSIAGTWLNYAPVTPGGQTVHHGDILHIGRIGLCYKVTDKTTIPKPMVLSPESTP